MRYYDLLITPPESNTTVLKQHRKGLHFSSYLTPHSSGHSYEPGGAPTDVFDAGALDISFHITTPNLSRSDSFIGGAAVTISGVDVATLSQAFNLEGSTLLLNAGMGKGLPLSNPHQTGTLLHGTIQSSLGLWEETKINLTLRVAPYLTVDDEIEKNYYTIDAKRGQSVLDAIHSNTRHYFDKTNIDLSVPKEQKLDRDFLSYHASLNEFFTSCGDLYKQTTGRPSYISIQGRDLFWVDTAKNVKKLYFEEVIGQPTWNGKNSITISCALRGDIAVGDIIHLDPSISKITIPSHYTPIVNMFAKNDSLFCGHFRVISMDHLGAFRSPDGRSWMSNITCEPLLNEDLTSLTDNDKSS